MSIDVRGAAGSQPMEPMAQTSGEGVTPEEWLLLRFYRKLGPAEQLFMRRALEGMATRLTPD